MYQAVIFFLKVSQNFISYESAEDRNLRAIFNRVKMHYLAIFFTKWHFNWDALLTCQRWTCFLQPPFFPRALKMVKFKGFRPATIWRGAAFHFLAVFSQKKNTLETLIVIFENVSPKGFSWLKMKYFETSVFKANQTTSE